MDNWFFGAKGLNNVNPFGGGGITKGLEDVKHKGIKGCWKIIKGIKGYWKIIKGIKGCWKIIKGIKGCSQKIKGIKACLENNQRD